MLLKTTLLLNCLDKKHCVFKPLIFLQLVGLFTSDKADTQADFNDHSRKYLSRGYDTLKVNLMAFHSQLFMFLASHGSLFLCLNLGKKLRRCDLFLY